MAPTPPRQLVPAAVEEQKNYPGSTTLYVILTCILAASGGLLFGYDIGISGGVEAMEDFQRKFFPDIARKAQSFTKETDYCKYNNHWLQTATSVLYLAALVSAFVASWVTDKYGRKLTMLLAGLVSLVGAGHTAGAKNLAMLIVGRALMGWGIGFANQVVPLYSSEMAPARWRGGLNILFQQGITIGIFLANVVNYIANRFMPHNGWRVSFAGAALPALLLATGGWLLPDTPLSLIRRDRPNEALAVLQRIRGTKEVQEEFGDTQEAIQQAESVSHPYQNILQRHNRPQLVISVCIMFFQQFTGINAVMFYAPVLFHTLGYGRQAALYSAVITGAVNLVATVVSMVAVDKWGRRFFLLAGGLQMFLSQMGIFISFHSADIDRCFMYSSDGHGHLPQHRRPRCTPRPRHVALAVASPGLGGGDHDLPVRGRLRLVLGSPVMADSQRDPDPRHPLRRPEHRRVRQHVLHVPRRPVLPLHLVRHEVGHFPLLRRLGGRHASVCAAVCARNQRHAHHFHGPGLEAALVLEEVHAPQGNPTGLYCKCGLNEPCS